MRREAGVQPAQWTTFDVDASASEYTDDSVHPCEQYIYRVQGVESNGGSASSNSVELRVQTDECLPGVPRNIALTVGNGWIVVRWDAPEYAGKPPFNGYQIRYRWADYTIAEGPGDFTTLWHDDLSINAITIDRGLTNDERYEVYVAAANSHNGDLFFGPAAGPESVRIPPNLGSSLPPYPERQPSAPRNLALTAGDGEIGVSWDAPSRLFNTNPRYLVEYRKAGTRRWIEEGLESSPTTIGYLERGVTYEVQVTVFDTYGDATAGPESVTTLGATQPEPTPDPSDDEDDTGSGDDGDTGDGDDDGQDDGQGDDEEAAPPNDDPKRPPTAPRSLSLTPGDGMITVSWSAPQDIGEPDDWIGYVVEIRDDREYDWFEYDFYEGTSATIDYLENGVEYEVRVVAFNLWGDGISVVKRATPNAP